MRNFKKFKLIKTLKIVNFKFTSIKILESDSFLKMTRHLIKILSNSIPYNLNRVFFKIFHFLLKHRKEKSVICDGLQTVLLEKKSSGKKKIDTEKRKKVEKN